MAQKEFQGKKSTLKELREKNQAHFGDHLNPNKSKKDIHTLPKSRKGENNFYFKNLTLEKVFDHIGLEHTGRHWLSLPD